MEAMIKPGLYRHFKGGEYEVYGVAEFRDGLTAQFKALAVHSETRQSVSVYLALTLTGPIFCVVDGPVVLYRPLYGERQLTVRPLAMFTDHIERDGYSGPRFVKLPSEAEPRGDGA